LRKSATDQLISLVPLLRRLPRRLDRISGSLERGRLGLNVRLQADEGDRRYLTELVHPLVLTFITATLGVMSVLMLGLHGGPSVTHKVTLYAFYAQTASISSKRLSRAWRWPQAVRPARARADDVGY
jgi:ubiquinone biosynthesis protein